MDVWKKMYATLCVAASLALDTLPKTPETAPARLLLGMALDEAEEIYIEETEGIREYEDEE